MTQPTFVVMADGGRPSTIFGAARSKVVDGGPSPAMTAWAAHDTTDDCRHDGGRQQQFAEDSMLAFGASMFFTDYSISPAELGQALEQRGCESVWAPEHSHIPLTRKT